ncbi:unnamed protein product [Gadus morhua 'NCC']
MIDCMYVLPSAVEQSLWVLVGIWMKIPSRDPEPRAWSWITLRPTQNWKPSQQQLERSPLCLFCSLLSLSDLEAHRGMGSPCSSLGICDAWVPSKVLGGLFKSQTSLRFSEWFKKEGTRVESAVSVPIPGNTKDETHWGTGHRAGDLLST